MYNEFSVGTDAPCVQGHFPGFPVVPGAWLLIKLEMALQETFPDWRLDSLGKVKFTAPLKPGERAIIHGDESAWPKVKVRIVASAGVVLETTALLTRGSSVTLTPKDS